MSRRESTGDHTECSRSVVQRWPRARPTRGADDVPRGNGVLAGLVMLEVDAEPRRDIAEAVRRPAGPHRLREPPRTKRVERWADDAVTSPGRAKRADVEARVVSDDPPICEELAEVLPHPRERRSILDVVPSDAVHHRVVGTEIALRIDQGRPRRQDGVAHEQRDTDRADARPRRVVRSLDVDRDEVALCRRREGERIKQHW